ncbi:MAG: hypothetical protein K2H70_04465, partial [Bacteroidales bacterium]|nr:hypothetical protein [Bacteroidales bacterium]
VRVDMKIFREGGNLLYSETDSSPVWKAYDAPAGNYVYEVTVELKRGSPVKKRGWITVLE